jgi:hypothetical protein
MCGAGVYLPGRLFVGESHSKIPRAPQQGIHHRCKDVADATAQLDEYAANKWFCVDSTIGKDIQDDSPVRDYVLSELPRRHLRTYSQRCAAWRRKAKFESRNAEGEEVEDEGTSNSTVDNSAE